MQIERVELAAPWIEDKLLDKHGVSVAEAEEALLNRLDERKAGRDDLGEMRYGAVGRTDAGRWLTVYFVMREARTAAVLSARDSTRAERATGRRRF